MIKHVDLTSFGLMFKVSGAPRRTPTTALASNFARSTGAASFFGRGAGVAPAAPVGVVEFAAFIVGVDSVQHRVVRVDHQSVANRVAELLLHLLEQPGQTTQGLQLAGRVSTTGATPSGLAPGRR